MLRLPVAEFHTLRTLGTGAGGAVRAVVHLPSGRKFALKPGTGQAARRELALLARWRHPNVVALEGLAEAPDGPPGLLLELMEGGPVVAGAIGGGCRAPRLRRAAWARLPARPRVHSW